MIVQPLPNSQITFLCSGIQIMESTEWHGHSPAKDMHNANRRKCEGKKKASFILPDPIVNLEVLIIDTGAAHMGDYLGLVTVPIAPSHKGRTDMLQVNMYPCC